MVAAAVAVVVEWEAVEVAVAGGVMMRKMEETIATISNAVEAVAQVALAADSVANVMAMKGAEATDVVDVAVSAAKSVNADLTIITDVAHAMTIIVTR